MIASNPSPFLRRLINFYRDPRYFRQLSQLTLPVFAQQFVLAVLNLLAVVFLGRISETAVAAVGLAGQVFFLLNLVLFGIISGSAIFTAQYWGRRDIHGLRRALSLCLALSLIGSLFFFSLAELFPAAILQLYSHDPAVIAMGSEYLRWYAWTYFFYAVSLSYSIVLRSIGDVRLPMAISILTLVLNTVLGFGLMFGQWGLPHIGVLGSAWSAVFTRGLECGLILVTTYLKGSPLAASPGELIRVDFTFAGRFFRPVLPVILNETLWSLGTTAYAAIYGNMSTAAITAMSIVNTLDQLALVFFYSLGNATAVMVGNQIGAGREDQAFQTAGRSLGLGALGGVLVGALIALIKLPVLSLYDVPPDILENVSRALVVISLFLWLRIQNSIIVIGVLRAGGDTLFSLFLDGIIIWMVGVPLTALGAFWLQWPVYLVYLCAMSEETAKWCLGMPRFFSRKWIRNLVREPMPLAR